MVMLKMLRVGDDHSDDEKRGKMMIFTWIEALDPGPRTAVEADPQWLTVETR